MAGLMHDDLLGVCQEGLRLKASCRRHCTQTSTGSFLSIAIIALSLSAGSVTAEETVEFTCKSGDLVRRLVVVETKPSTGQSCEVVYWKDTEAPGVRHVLWTAKLDAGYCYSKALGLAGKLGATGWTCNSVSLPFDSSEDQSLLDPLRTDLSRS